MKVNELRIGNTFNYGDHTQNIDINALRDWDHINNLFSPIRIMGDSLYSLGFHWDVENKCFYVNGCDDSFYVGIDFEQCNNGFYFGATGYGFLTEIFYVHQLQNLYFDLTGEELTEYLCKEQ